MSEDTTPAEDSKPADEQPPTDQGDGGGNEAPPAEAPPTE